MAQGLPLHRWLEVVTNSVRQENGRRDRGNVDGNVSGSGSGNGSAQQTQQEQEPQQPADGGDESTAAAQLPPLL